MRDELLDINERQDANAACGSRCSPQDVSGRAVQAKSDSQAPPTVRRMAQGEPHAYEGATATESAPQRTVACGGHRPAARAQRGYLRFLGTQSLCLTRPVSGKRGVPSSSGQLSCEDEEKR